jgi:hypothetical protein
MREAVDSYHLGMLAHDLRCTPGHCTRVQARFPAPAPTLELMASSIACLIASHESCAHQPHLIHILLLLPISAVCCMQTKADLVLGLWGGIVEAAESGCTEGMAQAVASAFMANGHPRANAAYALAFDSVPGCCEQCSAIGPVISRTRSQLTQLMARGMCSSDPPNTVYQPVWPKRRVAFVMLWS